ncbi:hypothetical protein DPEC_G00287670 [Dallia pectoralis]|uniref:Uncharacterized protein n=1 Tax=Dallia pectoralis TaxID=75939 RepID=A0ACC2FKA0_DALPE|nr:hypothetical protein DPEC_G00287670 [Dallia pectoralis]
MVFSSTAFKLVLFLNNLPHSITAINLSVILRWLLGLPWSQHTLLFSSDGPLPPPHVRSDHEPRVVFHVNPGELQPHCRSHPSQQPCGTAQEQPIALPDFTSERRLVSSCKLNNATQNRRSVSLVVARQRRGALALWKEQFHRAARLGSLAGDSTCRHLAAAAGIERSSHPKRGDMLCQRNQY